MVLLEGVRSTLAELDAAAKDCVDVIQANRVVEALESLMRNDVRLVLATWRTKLTELVGKGVNLDDGRRVYTVPSYSYEWDHPRIADLVAHRALYSAEGERIDDPEEIATRAVKLMAACYVTPSTEPRTEGLTLLGFERKDAAAKHRTEKAREVRKAVPKTRSK